MFKRIDFFERRTIQELLDHGTEIKDIAIITNRSSSAISSEIKRHGGIRNYNAEEAQRISDEKSKLGNKDKNSPIQHLRKRVSDLEEKIEKLINSLKESGKC